jgi:TolA-binding protein
VAGNEPSNKQADEALRAVQVYIRSKLYTKARIKLQEIISAYPSTDAAKKAKELLSQLPEK